jgi:hypothetical protein
MTDTTQAATVTDPTPAADLSAAIETNAVLAEIDAVSLHTGYSKALTGARAQLVTALMFVEMHFRQLETKAADLFASAETAPDASAATPAAQ